jgi:hypothetical protein
VKFHPGLVCHNCISSSKHHQGLEYHNSFTCLSFLCITSIKRNNAICCCITQGTKERITTSMLILKALKQPFLHYPRRQDNNNQYCFSLHFCQWKYSFNSNFEDLEFELPKEPRQVNHCQSFLRYCLLHFSIANRI